MWITNKYRSAVLVKKGNLLPPCRPRTVSTTGAVAPAAPVAPAPLTTLWQSRQIVCSIYCHLHSTTQVVFRSHATILGAKVAQCRSAFRVTSFSNPHLYPFPSYSHFQCQLVKWQRNKRYFCFEIKPTFILTCVCAHIITIFVHVEVILIPSFAIVQKTLTDPFLFVEIIIQFQRPTIACLFRQRAYLQRT
jgi:hypothetical protein